MHRLTLVGSLATALAITPGLAGVQPAEAATVTRFRVVVTSLSGVPITLTQITETCAGPPHHVSCSTRTESQHLITSGAGHRTVIRVKKRQFVNVFFESNRGAFGTNRRFRVRVYVHGAEILDRRSYLNESDRQEYAFKCIGRGALRFFSESD